MCRRIDSLDATLRLTARVDFHPGVLRPRRGREKRGQELLTLVEKGRQGTNEPADGTHRRKIPVGHGVSPFTSHFCLFLAAVREEASNPSLEMTGALLRFF